MTPKLSLLKMCLEKLNKGLITQDLSKEDLCSQILNAFKVSPPYFLKAQVKTFLEVLIFHQQGSRLKDKCVLHCMESSLSFLDYLRGAVKVYWSKWAHQDPVRTRDPYAFYITMIWA